MNAIIGMSHLALGTTLDLTQRAYVQHCHQSALALLRILNDILDLSKIEAQGPVPVAARAGRAAIHALGGDAGIACVLMDCHMPGTDGFEATRRIRAQSRWRDLPVIAMTAGAMAEDIGACVAAGMDDHLSKPIDVPVLQAKLGRWPSRAAARRVRTGRAPTRRAAVPGPAQPKPPGPAAGPRRCRTG